MIKKDYSIPVFYLVHPDEMMESYSGVLKRFFEQIEEFGFVNFGGKNKKTNDGIELYELSQRWLDYAKTAKKEGVFVPIFARPIGELIEKSECADFYKELLELEKEEENSMIAVVDGLGKTKETYGPLTYHLKDIEFILKKRNSDFSKSKHIIGGVIANYCPRSVAEMLVYGSGTDSLGNVQLISASPMVPLENVVMAKHYMNPLREEITLKTKSDKGKMVNIVKKTNPYQINKIVAIGLN